MFWTEKNAVPNPAWNIPHERSPLTTSPLRVLITLTTSHLKKSPLKVSPLSMSHLKTSPLTTSHLKTFPPRMSPHTTPHLKTSHIQRSFFKKTSSYSTSHLNTSTMKHPLRWNALCHEISSIMKNALDTKRPLSGNILYWVYSPPVMKFWKLKVPLLENENEK